MAMRWLVKGGVVAFNSGEGRTGGLQELDCAAHGWNRMAMRWLVKGGVAAFNSGDGRTGGLQE